MSGRTDIGIVVIARDEGERLCRSLDSLRQCGAPVVYADSCSTDGSVELARERGIEVVELDRTRPVNAARARNAGFARLLELHPGLAHVFFVDGDCRLVDGFLEQGRAALEADPGLAAVCGRRRESAPEASPYNRVVDSEWNTPVGETEAAGGDVLVRVRAFAEIGGYEETLDAGEDPEMCFRLRRRGWRIRRIAADMTLHDVALTSFGAWWKRHARGGHAYARSALLHAGLGYNHRACASILFWGALLPLFLLACAIGGAWGALALLAGYPLLWLRVRASRLALGEAHDRAALYASFIVLGKFAEAQGVLACFVALARGREARAAEYEDPAAGARRAA